MVVLKIRSGFVSNSSSSSFVAVCFKAPADFDERLKTAIGVQAELNWSAVTDFGFTFDTESFGSHYTYQHEERPRLVGISIFEDFEGDVDALAVTKLSKVIEQVEKLANKVGFTGKIELVAGVVGDG